jgi:hypothetical protein
VRLVKFGATGKVKRASRKPGWIKKWLLAEGERSFYELSDPHRGGAIPDFRQQFFDLVSLSPVFILFGSEILSFLVLSVVF